MNLSTVFLRVTACALIGMLMGGLFGYWGGNVTPDLFKHLFPSGEIEPEGLATSCGATAGVVLGGGLGCFGIVMQFWTKRSDDAATAPPAPPPNA